ncbi:MAG: hypothetical protein ACOC5R_03055 [Elusimicrobiota bacterium]
MERRKVKKLVIVFSGIFIFLFFVAWQQVVLFRMGYKITELKKKIYNQEVKRQKLMDKANRYYPLSYIDTRARNEYKMHVPCIKECRIIETQTDKLLCKKKSYLSFLAYIKEIFSPEDAQAK